MEVYLIDIVHPKNLPFVEDDLTYQLISCVKLYRAYTESEFAMNRYIEFLESAIGKYVTIEVSKFPIPESFSKRASDIDAFMNEYCEDLEEGTCDDCYIHLMDMVSNLCLQHTVLPENGFYLSENMEAYLSEYAFPDDFFLEGFIRLATPEYKKYLKWSHKSFNTFIKRLLEVVSILSDDPFSIDGPVIIDHEFIKCWMIYMKRILY